MKYLYSAYTFHCSSKIERMARETMDVCLRGLKENNRFDRKQCFIISHINFGEVACTFKFRRQPFLKKLNDTTNNNLLFIRRKMAFKYMIYANSLSLSNSPLLLHSEDVKDLSQMYPTLYLE